MKKDKEWLIDEIRKLPCKVQRGYFKIKAVDILPLIEQLDESEKVVIPKFVADHIELCKSKNKRLNVALSESPENEMAFEMGVNLEEANEIYARAWLDGYQIEKEKLYQVIIPTKDKLWKYYYLDHDGGINMVDRLKYVESHTEEFIRSVSDDLWQFAMEVAE